MNNSNNSANKKYKRPKQKTQSTTNPESSRQGNHLTKDNKGPEILCPLAAKDSEWVDILQTPVPESINCANVSEEEEVLQLVDCEDGPQMKPLAIMFPGLLEKDPNTLEGVLNKVMSTTEVTKHLVDLGQKANFTFMKKADRLIPRDKQWLERLTENSNSITSMASTLFNSNISSAYGVKDEEVEDFGWTFDEEHERAELKLRKETEKHSNPELNNVSANIDATTTKLKLTDVKTNETDSQSKLSTDDEAVDY